jgi:hypothetical protein
MEVSSRLSAHGVHRAGCPSSDRLDACTRLSVQRFDSPRPIHDDEA